MKTFVAFRIRGVLLTTATTTQFPKTPSAQTAEYATHRIIVVGSE
jgi:hypothetical protein